VWSVWVRLWSGCSTTIT
jgi:hypothetical protein